MSSSQSAATHTAGSYKPCVLKFSAKAQEIADLSPHPADWAVVAIPGYFLRRGICVKRVAKQGGRRKYISRTRCRPLIGQRARA